MSSKTETEKPMTKLSLRREAVRNLSVRTGIQTGTQCQNTQIPFTSKGGVGCYYQNSNVKISGLGPGPGH